MILQAAALAALVGGGLAALALGRQPGKALAVTTATAVAGCALGLASAVAGLLGPAVEAIYPWTVDPPGRPRRLRGRLTWLLLRPGRLDRDG